MTKFSTALLAAAAVMSVAAAGASWSKELKDYPGEDAGFMVIAMGSGTSIESRAISYTLNFRRKETSEVGTISFTPHRPALPFLGTKRDFDEPNETGFVDVRKLAPGEYEIYGISAAMYGTLQWRWQPKDEFSIPFTISAGVATYLGDFRGVGTSERSAWSLGAPLPTGAYFVVSNRADRDLPIARRKAPKLDQVNPAVPTEAVINSRYFQFSCLPSDCH
jgi:hypothetical protein